MASTASPLARTSQFLGHFRSVFMPLALVALIAVGVHAAADLLSGTVLWWVQQAQSRVSTVWPQVALSSLQQTQVARSLTLAWELWVDALFAVPMLAYREVEAAPPSLPRRTSAGRGRPLRALSVRTVTAPLVTFVFGLAGAYAVSRQVEATLFVGLQGDVTSVSTAQWVAHLAGAVTMVLTFFSATWRAAVLAFARARERCLALQARGAPVMADGLGSMLLAAPMVAVWLLNAQSLAALIVPGP